VELLNYHIIRQAYEIKVGVRFAPFLQEVKGETTVNDTWNSTKSAFQDIAAEVLVTTKPRGTKDWLSIETRQLATERRGLKACKRDSPRSTNHYNYLCREIKRRGRADK